MMEKIILSGAPRPVRKFTSLLMWLVIWLKGIKK